MVDTLSRVYTLLFAVGVLLIGHGLQLTLLPLYALSLGWSGTWIGLTGSFYFIGFAAGCVLVPAIVARVGHIRAFMVMTAVATVALLLAAVMTSVPAWVLLRFAIGMALAGLYMIVESWLTDVCPPDRRGGVLSVYLVVSLIGMAVGQLPMMLVQVSDLRLFILAAVFLAAASIPVGLTQIASPRPVPSVRITPATLIRASRVAVVCVVLAGMVTGAFWVLGPVVGREFGLSTRQVGLMVSLGILGGAAFQYPVGWLSDRFDRRVVIAALAAVGAIVGLLGFLLAGSGDLLLLVSIALLCASAMPLYAVCIALAAERTDLSLVEIASGMLLGHGLGSVLGPMLIAPLISAFGPGMFFLVCALCLLGAATWSLYRFIRIDVPADGEAHRPMLPRTTQAVAEMIDRDAEP